MRGDQFRKLQSGDVVSRGGQSYIVADNSGGRVTVVAVLQIEDPAEWQLVFHANHRRPATPGGR